MVRSDVFESIDGSNKNLSQCVISHSIKNKQSNSSPQNHTTKLRSGDTGAASVGFNFWCLAQMKFTTHSFKAWNSLRFLRVPPHVDARESKKPSTFPGKSTKKSVVSQGVHLLLTFKGIIFSDWTVYFPGATKTFPLIWWFNILVDSSAHYRHYLLPISKMDS